MSNTMLKGKRVSSITESLKSLGRPTSFHILKREPGEEFNGD